SRITGNEKAERTNRYGAQRLHGFANGGWLVDMGVIEPELREQGIGLIGAADAEIRVVSDGRAHPVQREIGREGRRIVECWIEKHIVAAGAEAVGPPTEAGRS